ncbi:uncharacterized protein LOC111319800 isoform X2 [Stylophora pistillata]|uniref:uncharacterized protein LOC111319800 isoform X2 n=1 Tax=Stylophora pistillata TaxID=50429 RepID=UPI000C046BEF|nr:uncharacterized protein LOC111319800 isoform X2 [Stylophora pistillata]
MPPELKDKIPDLSDLKNNFREFKDVQLPIDILLLTVKDIEFQSCYFYLKDVFQSYEKDLGYVYFGEMGEVGNAKLKVALFKCSAKPGGALLAVMNTVRKLRPKAVFCVGCCGALHRDMTNLGDVIVSAKLTTFAQRLVTNQGVHPCGFSVPVSNDIGKIIQYASCGWKAPLKNPEERGSVKVHTDGEFLSGPEEIDSEERWRELVKLYPNAIAIEKDGEGVFSAAQDLRMEWVVIKGISNYVDGTASFTEKWEPFASAMAASVVNNILRTPVVFKEWAHYKSSDTARAQNEAQASARFNAEEGNGGSWDNTLGSLLQSLTSESGQETE